MAPWELKDMAEATVVASTTSGAMGWLARVLWKRSRDNEEARIRKFAREEIYQVTRPLSERLEELHEAVNNTPQRTLDLINSVRRATDK